MDYNQFVTGGGTTSHLKSGGWDSFRKVQPIARGIYLCWLIADWQWILVGRTGRVGKVNLDSIPAPRSTPWLVFVSGKYQDFNDGIEIMKMAHPIPLLFEGNTDNLAEDATLR